MLYQGYGADLSIDDNILVLTKKGLGAKVIGNAGARRIPLEALVGVNFKDATRLVNGYLQLVIGSESPGKAEASDPNTILFRHKSRAQFGDLRDYLLRAVERNRKLGIDSTAVAYDQAAKTHLQAADEHLQLAEEHRASKERELYLKRRELLISQLGGPGVAREDIVDAVASMHWRLGGGREIKKLLEYLSPGEDVRKIGQGTYRGDQGIVVLTNSRLLFLFHGLTRRALEDFPLGAISSVSTKSGMVTGDLKVFASGNEAVIGNIIKADLEPFAAALRYEITQVRSQGHAAGAEIPSTSADSDSLRKIAELAELRDRGILTDEEFNAKKAELLGRL